jgi:hypothetical protein
MKIVKLDRRHLLYKEGWTWALRFSYRSEHAVRMLGKLRELYGSEYVLGIHQNIDKHHWTRYWAPTKSYGRPFYLGFKKEEDLTAIILMVPE